MFLAATFATIAIGVAVVLVLTHPAAPRPPAVAETHSATEAAVPVTIADANANARQETDAGSEDVRVDAALPAVSAAGAVLAVCARDDFALCVRKLWHCECLTDEGFAVFDQPEDQKGTYKLRTLEGEGKHRTECRGCTHGSKDGVYSSTPSAGRWRCSVSCDDQEILAGRRMAVPDTPCVGWISDEPTPGRWRAWKGKK